MRSMRRFWGLRSRWRTLFCFCIFVFWRGLSVGQCTAGRGRKKQTQSTSEYRAPFAPRAPLTPPHNSNNNSYLKNDSPPRVAVGDAVEHLPEVELDAPLVAAKLARPRAVHQALEVEVEELEDEVEAALGVEDVVEAVFVFVGLGWLGGLGGLVRGGGESDVAGARRERREAPGGSLLRAKKVGPTSRRWGAPAP